MTLQPDQKCEVYSRDRKRWIEGKVIDIFDDKEGQWVKVKYVAEMRSTDQHLRAFAPERNMLKWTNVGEAVKQELYPHIATQLKQSVDELVRSGTLIPSDFGDTATDNVITKLQTKKVLYNKEIKYIQGLVKRARAFRWNESESMFFCHSLSPIEFNHSGDSATVHSMSIFVAWTQMVLSPMI